MNQRFILNNDTISTDIPSATTLLDFIRYQKNLTGTKIGCREGDCGACTVLVGELQDEKMQYKSLTSCITPIGNVNGKHVVSIEGLNMEFLSPVQQAMVDESGTQCGFCTPGFVVSLSGSCLSDKIPSQNDLISDISGNICRCTGYKSIERAVTRIKNFLEAKESKRNIDWLIENKFIPTYFSSITKRIEELEVVDHAPGQLIVGGGTDLYVQKHHEAEESEINFVSSQKNSDKIKIDNNLCTIDGTSIVTDLMESEQLKAFFPNLTKHLSLVASKQVRNVATIAGNFVNASPIGDLTIFFLALNAKLTLKNDKGNEKTLLLKDFYKAYKVIDKKPDEIITQIQFCLPDENTYFNFEKVSKRTFLDIASVNTAISLRLSGDSIEEIHISAGGVGPTPTYLKETAAFLKGKALSVENIQASLGILESEISPITDVRGTKEYKCTLLKRLFLAHFIEMFSNTFSEVLL